MTKRRWPPKREGDWEMFTLDAWIEMYPTLYRARPAICRLKHEDDDDATATHVYAFMGVNEVSELIVCTSHSAAFIAFHDA